MTAETKQRGASSQTEKLSQFDSGFSIRLTYNHGVCALVVATATATARPLDSCVFVELNNRFCKNRTARHPVDYLAGVFAVCVCACDCD